MAIGKVLKRGDFIYVYSDRGLPLYQIPLALHSEDALQDFDDKAVRIRRGRFVYSYDEYCQVTGRKPVS
ncbi:MAG TPA: hypothetical protein VF265_09155 [Nevskiaceae bacterium]